jgi:hypothetical protein
MLGRKYGRRYGIRVERQRVRARLVVLAPEELMAQGQL